MPRCRYGTDLLQSDAVRLSFCRELDIVEKFSRELGIELYRPEQPERMRLALDADSTLSSLLDDLIEGKRDSDALFHFYGLPLVIVVLSACAMSVGAKLEGRHRSFLAALLDSLPTIEGLYPQGRDKFARALNEYEDGKPVEGLAGKTVGQAAADRFLGRSTSSYQPNDGERQEGFVTWGMRRQSKEGTQHTTDACVEQ